MKIVHGIMFVRKTKSWGTWLAELMECAVLHLRVELKPNFVCRAYLKKKKDKIVHNHDNYVKYMHGES